MANDETLPGPPIDPREEFTPTPEPSSPAPAPSAGVTAAPPPVGVPDRPAETGAYTTPPVGWYASTPATPPVTTGSVPSSLAPVKRAEPVEKHTYTADDIIQMKQEAMAERKREWDEYYKLQAPYYKWVEAKLKEPPPPVPQAPQTPPPPSEQESMNNLKKKTIGYLAVALPLAILMGARGGWAAAGAWGGLGKGLTALAEGNDQDARESFQKWMDIDRVAQQKFDNQMTVYKNTLENRNMTIQNMMDIIGFNAKQFGDKRVQEQADMNDWDGMLSAIQQKEDAKRKYDQFMFNSQIKLAALKAVKEDATIKDWKEIVNQKAIQILGHGMDADHPQSEEERQLLRQYPIERYWKLNPKPAPNIPGAPQQSEGQFIGGDEEKSEPSEEDFKSLFPSEPAP